jgi:hypothetical protein
MPFELPIRSAAIAKMIAKKVAEEVSLRSISATYL